MMDKFLDVLKSHPLEDELMCSVLRVGICKSLAVLGLDASAATNPGGGGSNQVEEIRRSVEGGLKSPCLGAQTMTLHGILYLLQTESPNLAKAVNSVFVPLTMEYLQVPLTTYSRII